MSEFQKYYACNWVVDTILYFEADTESAINILDQSRCGLRLLQKGKMSNGNEYWQFGIQPPTLDHLNQFVEWASQFGASDWYEISQDDYNRDGFYDFSEQKREDLRILLPNSQKARHESYRIHNSLRTTWNDYVIYEAIWIISHPTERLHTLFEIANANASELFYVNFDTPRGLVALKLILISPTEDSGKNFVSIAESIIAAQWKKIDKASVPNFLHGDPSTLTPNIAGALRQGLAEIASRNEEILKQNFVE